MLQFSNSQAAFFDLASGIFYFYSCKKCFLPGWKTFLTWVENDFHQGKTIFCCLPIHGNPYSNQQLTGMHSEGYWRADTM